jgi:hypothetical protein
VQNSSGVEMVRKTEMKIVMTEVKMVQALRHVQVAVQQYDQHHVELQMDELHIFLLDRQHHG